MPLRDASYLNIIVWENPMGQIRDNFANEGGAFLCASLHNSGVQIVPENSKVHAAEISRESIRLGSSIRARWDRMREEGRKRESERLGRLGSVKPGRKRKGGERRLPLLLSLCM